jgi:hypothetical protein
VTYLRFAPRDYWAVCRLLYGFDLCRPLGDLKQFLVTGLAAKRPALAERVSRLDARELRVLREHFRRRRETQARHGLSSEEIRTVAEALRSPLMQSRSLLPVKEAVSGVLAKTSPNLGRKVRRMSLEDFEALYNEVRVSRPAG